VTQDQRNARVRGRSCPLSGAGPSPSSAGPGSWFPNLHGWWRHGGIVPAGVSRKSANPLAMIDSRWQPKLCFQHYMAMSGMFSKASEEMLQRSGRRGHRFKSGYPDQVKGHFPARKMPFRRQYSSKVQQRVHFSSSPSRLSLSRLSASRVFFVDAWVYSSIVIAESACRRIRIAIRGWTSRSARSVPHVPRAS